MSTRKTFQSRASDSVPKFSRTDAHPVIPVSWRWQPTRPEGASSLDGTGYDAASRFNLRDIRIHADEQRVEVSSPEGPHEREAEHVAEKLVGARAVTPGVSRLPARPGAASPNRAGAAEHGDTVLPEVETARGGGQPLPSSLRNYFEPRLKHDLGNVRIHADEQSARLSRALDAAAFTRGNDIFFGPSAFSPDSTAGRTLIAHELVHTIQQERIPSQPLLQRQPASSARVLREDTPDNPRIEGVPGKRGGLGSARHRRQHHHLPEQLRGDVGRGGRVPCHSRGSSGALAACL